jgi:hypothetical protein
LTEDIRSKIFNYLSFNERTVKFCGEDVVVVGMTVAMRNRIARDALNVDGTINTGKILDKYPEILIECIRNKDTKEKIFRVTDRDSILALPSVESDRIFRMAMELSGLDSGHMDSVQKN